MLWQKNYAKTVGDIRHSRMNATISGKTRLNAQCSWKMNFQNQDMRLD